MPKELPSQEYLNSVLAYNHVSGRLTWKTRGVANWDARYAGTPAMECINNTGYYHGTVAGKDYLTHRIIMKMVTGKEPIQVDHIDGDPLNNALGNLRSVCNQENNKNRKLHGNSSTGVMGVHLERGRYRARIRVDGRHISLGSFASIDDAIVARRAADRRYGFHPNHGRTA